MPVHDELGIRMKEYYEQIPKTKLMRRTPVIIRIDGKAFHSFTRGFKRPFDDVLIDAMQSTMKYLCENIQGCVLGYHQSDEISLVLVDYQNLNSAAWFDYEVQKMCSIAASMATMAFNKIFEEKCIEYSQVIPMTESGHEIMDIYSRAAKKGAMFDARCFNIPKEEITNYFYWRQLDATRNSIQMVGRANFSHKELHEKSCNQIQDMLMTQKGINWNDFPIYQKRGSCCVKEKYSTVDLAIYTGKIDFVTRTRWVVDKEIPIFKAEEREYIDRLIYVDVDNYKYSKA